MELPAELLALSGLGDGTGPAGAGARLARMAAAEERLATSRRERLEAVCASMVDQVAALPSAGAGAPQGTVDAVGADDRKATDAARRRKQEEASWGKGLSKGFLSRPPRKKRRAATSSAESTHKENAARPTSKETANAPAVPPQALTEASKSSTAAGAAVTGASPELQSARSERPRCAVCFARLPVTALVGSMCRCSRAHPCR